MKYRAKYQAYGQEHDDVWIGARSKKHVEDCLMEICPSVHIHSIEKTDYDETTETNAIQKGAFEHIQIFEAPLDSRLYAQA